MGHRNWEGFPHSVIYRNNLFAGNGKAVISELNAVMKAGKFENNFFINVPNLPNELNQSEGFKEYLQKIGMANEIMSNSGLK